MENKSGKNVFKFILMFCGGFLLGILALISYQSYVGYNNSAGKVEEQIKEDNEKDKNEINQTSYNGPKECGSETKKIKLTNKEFNELKNLEVCTTYEIDKLNTFITPTKCEENYYYEFEIIIGNKRIPYTNYHIPKVTNINNNVGIISPGECCDWTDEYIYTQNGELVFDSIYLDKWNGHHNYLVDVTEQGLFRYKKTYVNNVDYSIDGREIISNSTVMDYCGEKYSILYVYYDLVEKNGLYELEEVFHECEEW